MAVHQLEALSGSADWTEMSFRLIRPAVGSPHTSPRCAKPEPKPRDPANFTGRIAKALSLYVARTFVPV